MRMVGIDCKILVDDDTAKWVEELIERNALPSELAFYLTQRKAGGYIVKAEELDDIVNDAIESLEDNTQRDTIEEAVKNALTEFLTSGTISLGTVAQPASVVSSSKPIVEEEIDSDMVTFVSDGDEDSGEGLSDEDADDLADFFGF